jgi:hypothetical protein
MQQERFRLPGGGRIAPVLTPCGQGICYTNRFTISVGGFAPS